MHVVFGEGSALSFSGWTASPSPRDGAGIPYRGLWFNFISAYKSYKSRANCIKKHKVRIGSQTHHLQGDKP